MSKYLYTFVGKSYGSIRRGAYTTGNAFAAKYKFPFHECSNLTSESYTGFRMTSSPVLLTQKLDLYPGWSYITGKDDVIYTRKEFNKEFFSRSCSNGFNYWNSSSIKYFVPVIVDFVVEPHNLSKPSIGFYNSPNIRLDSTYAFIDLIQDLDVDIWVMGYEIPSLQGDSRYHFTIDREELLKNVSHYFYYPSTKVEDVFPNSLLEAVQNNKQIIIPENIRNFKDGIDDIKSCIKFHTKFSDKLFDNSDCVLFSGNFDKFYHSIFNNGWRYSQSRKAENFYDWCTYNL